MSCLGFWGFAITRRFSTGQAELGTIQAASHRLAVEVPLIARAQSVDYASVCAIA